MPALFRDPDQPIFHVRAVVEGKWVVYDLSPEGERYLTEELGLGHGDHFPARDLEDLRRRAWARTPGSRPLIRTDLPPLTRIGRARMSPVMSPGAVQIRLESADATLLDQTCESLIKTLFETGCTILGPIPLPVRIERYAILTQPAPRYLEYRTYKRLLQVRRPRQETVETMNRLELPREVDVRIDMLPERPAPTA